MTTRPRMELVMDWKAAVWAGIAAGIVFLIAEPLFSLLATDTGSAFDTEISIGIGTIIVGLLVHFMLSILFAFLIAFSLHQWGFVVGVVGGALFGLALYFINAFLFSLMFDWFFPANSWPYLVSHLLYGATAGGVYEWLENQIYATVT